MSEQTNISGKARPFPWRCVDCGEKEVFPLVTDYTTTMKHEGRPYTLRIPDLAIPTCRKCGEQVFTVETGDRIAEFATRYANTIFDPSSRN